MDKIEICTTIIQCVPLNWFGSSRSADSDTICNSECMSLGNDGWEVYDRGRNAGGNEKQSWIRVKVFFFNAARFIGNGPF